MRLTIMASGVLVAVNSEALHAGAKLDYSYSTVVTRRERETPH